MPRLAVQPSPENQRLLGVYYTPRALSDVVCGWAVRTAQDMILEPSFGGCVFLRAVSEALAAKGTKKPERHVYGCDVDKTAFFHLAASFPCGFPEENFRKGNFLNGMQKGSCLDS
jgi:adenine-specific DNA-methyltransferase